MDLTLSEISVSESDLEIVGKEGAQPPATRARTAASAILGSALSLPGSASTDSSYHKVASDGPSPPSGSQVRGVESPLEPHGDLSPGARTAWLQASMPRAGASSADPSRGGSPALHADKAQHAGDPAAASDMLGPESGSVQPAQVAPAAADALSQASHFGLRELRQPVVIPLTRFSGATKEILGAADDALRRAREVSVSDIRRRGPQMSASVSQQISSVEKSKTMSRDAEMYTNDVRRKPPDGHLRIMIVGESGLGKSTLVETLFMTDLTEPNSSGGQILDPTKAICEHQALIITEHEGEKRVLHLSVVDTPGFGDELECGTRMKKIVEYVEEQFERTNKVFSQEWGGGSKMVKFLDRGNGVHSHIDACLYFIAAHRLKKIDLEFMELLQDKVNIIPIIAKADTMTVEELAEFRTVILTQLMERKVRVFPFTLSPISSFDNHMKPADASEEDDNYDSEDESKDKVASLLEASSSGKPPKDGMYPPFAVIGSRRRVKNGKFGREYRWGSCEVENPDHCDFLALRERLLYDPWLSSLRTSTARKFVRWRKGKGKAAPAPKQSKKGSAWRRFMWMIALFLLLLPIYIIQTPIEAEADPLHTFVYPSTLAPCCAADDWGNRTLTVFPRLRQLPFLPSRPALPLGWSLAAATRSETGWHPATVEKMATGSGWSIKFVPPKPAPSKARNAAKDAKEATGADASAKAAAKEATMKKEELFDEATSFYLAVWIVKGSGVKEHIAGSPFRVPKYIEGRERPFWGSLSLHWLVGAGFSWNPLEEIAAVLVNNVQSV